MTDDYVGGYSPIEQENTKLECQVDKLEEENKQLEQEKCELLGIIQKKDELILKLVKELEYLKAQIMKMRGCINCKHFIDYNENTDDYFTCELEIGELEELEELKRT